MSDSDFNPRQIVRDGYDRISTAYRSRFNSEDSKYAAWIETICSDLTEDSHILDLGCGCGVPVSQMLAARCRVTGVDISAVQIELARKSVPEVHFICEDISELKFEPESFDAIVAFYSIIHLPLNEHAPLLRRIATWLRPGGRFLCTLGSSDWTGTEQDWLEVPGATMYWSHADAPTYRQWLHAAEMQIVHEEFTPEPLGNGGHQFFHTKRTNKRHSH